MSLIHAQNEREAINFNQIPMMEAVMELLAEHPTDNVSQGRFYFNTTTNLPYVYSNAGWTQLVPAGTPTGIKTVTSNYTALITDSTICANDAESAVTVQLPTSVADGWLLTVKKVSSSQHSVTISGNGKQIDASSSVLLSTQWDSVTVQYYAALSQWILV